MIAWFCLQINNSLLMLYMHMCPIYNFRDQDVKQTSGQFRSLNPMDLQLLRLTAICCHSDRVMIFVTLTISQSEDPLVQLLVSGRNINAMYATTVS